MCSLSDRKQTVLVQSSFSALTVFELVAKTAASSTSSDLLCLYSCTPDHAKYSHRRKFPFRGEKLVRTSLEELVSPLRALQPSEVEFTILKAILTYNPGFLSLQENNLQTRQVSVRWRRRECERCGTVCRNFSSRPSRRVAPRPRALRQPTSATTSFFCRPSGFFFPLQRQSACVRRDLCLSGAAPSAPSRVGSVAAATDGENPRGCVQPGDRRPLRERPSSGYGASV